MAERIPFSEAIADELLLKNWFDQLSLPQQVALKAFYGLPLAWDRVDKLGWSELDYWSAFQGSVEYDELGYLAKVTPVPYEPMEFTQAWLCLGRRWGKTDRFSSTVIAYEAALGGHEDYIRKGQEAVCFLVSQDLKVAHQNLPLVYQTLKESPLLAKEIDGDPTADTIRLKNGIAIKVAPPTAKAVRGYAVPVVCMDEVGIWYTTSDSANPDFEVERAVKYAQLQFPHKKRLGTSTPWTKEGLLWKNCEAGTQGRNIKDPTKRKAFRSTLVLHSTSAASGNPFITRDGLQQEFDQDQDAFERESLARFTASVSGFLNPTLVRASVSQSVYTRSPELRNIYVAALDPAFKRDAFGFTIVHRDDEGRIVQDIAIRWKAEHGKSLNPAVILDEIKPYLTAYKVQLVYSDQYHLESLQQLALDRGFVIEGVPFTSSSKARIFGNLQQLFNLRKVQLLDSRTGMDAAKETIEELLMLERRNTEGGVVQISAPKNRHDDMACVLALACSKAVYMFPVSAKKVEKEPTLFEKCMDNIRRKRLQSQRGSSPSLENYD